jgi:stearoyl-CoA desaturase (Delta-9 desaturase)
MTVLATDEAARTSERPIPSASVRRARVGVPFVAVHLGVLALPIVGWSWAALSCCAVLYVARALGITVFYHRGFAHRAFTMRRPIRLAGALLGAAAAQRGPLWWVATHRVHHRLTDRPGDPHSPVVDGFLHSHVGWLFRPETAPPGNVADLAHFRELRLVDRYHYLAPVGVAFVSLAAGSILGRLEPGLHTSGPQMMVWGFFVSTTLLYHATFSVNSVAHHFGPRRFATRDASRNNGLVSLLTMGEGWHNNHHRFPASARQGLGRFELDPSWWVIRALAALHLFGELRPVPATAWAEAGLKPARAAGARESVAGSSKAPTTCASTPSSPGLSVPRPYGRPAGVVKDPRGTKAATCFLSEPTPNSMWRGLA